MKSSNVVSEMRYRHLICFYGVSYEATLFDFNRVLYSSVDITTDK